VAGGHDGQVALASAERFSPLEGTWETLPSMPTARSRCAAAAVEGKLYIIGGRDSRSSSPTSATERLDTRSGRWEAVPPLPMALEPLGCAAAVLAGDIYVVGLDVDRQMSVGRFDPQVMRWLSLPVLRSTPGQRFGCTAAACSGAVYFLGGHDGHQAVASTERFDPQNGGCCLEQLPSAPTPRHGCAAAVASGVVYVLGGDDGKSLAAAEAFDPSRFAWESLPPLPTGRFGCAAAAAWL